MVANIQNVGAIAERALLLDLTLRKWGASKHDKEVSREVAQQHGSDESMGRFAKDLVRKDWPALAEMRALCGEWERWHRAVTVPWGDDGQRVLASALYLSYVETTNGYRDRHAEIASRIFDEFEAEVDEAARRLSGLFRRSDYPTRRALERKYRVEVEFFGFPTATDIRVSVGNAELERLQAGSEATIRRRLEEAMRQVAKRVETVVGSMVEQLTKLDADQKGKFQDSLVENVSKMVDLLPALNITANPEMEAFERRMRADLLKHSAQTLRDSGSARAETAKAAQEILDAVSAFAA